MSVFPLMIESMPRGSWQDDATVTRFLDHAGAHLVPRLQDQCELPLQQITLKPLFAKAIKRQVMDKNCFAALIILYM